MDRLDGSTYSRRSFLRGSGLTLAGVGLSSLFPSSFIEYAMAAGPYRNRRLLFIFLRGGNDGINTVIPHGDADYSPANRPTLHIPPASATTSTGSRRSTPGSRT